MMEHSRKKILFVHHGSGMGGAPQLLLKLLLHIDRTRYEPVVWCIRRSSASEMFSAHGFRVIIDEGAIPFLHISDGFYGIRHPHVLLKMLWGQLRSYRTARRIIGQEAPDIIHLNSSVIPGILFAASHGNCPVIINILECLHPGYTGLRRGLIIHLTKSWADYFVFMLPSEAERWGLSDSPNTVIVFDFIELDAFRTGADPGTLRRQLALPETAVIVGYFGRFTRAKGVHLLLRALVLLRQKRLPVHLLLVGPEETYTCARGILGFKARKAPRTLQAHITGLGLEKDVTIMGERTDVGELVQQCDILAAPFIEPHFSRLCGEAAAAGRPTAAFNIDGPGEEIVDGKTGVLAHPEDIQDLADKLEHLIRHPDERKRMGRAAAAHADLLFSAERNVLKVISLYVYAGKQACNE